MIQMAMIHIMLRRLEPTCQYSLASQMRGVRLRRPPKFPNPLSVDFANKNPLLLTGLAGVEPLGLLAVEPAEEFVRAGAGAIR